jgi:hypothetical protein
VHGNVLIDECESSDFSKCIGRKVGIAVQKLAYSCSIVIHIICDINLQTFVLVMIRCSLDDYEYIRHELVTEAFYFSNWEDLKRILYLFATLANTEIKTAF